MRLMTQISLVVATLALLSSSVRAQQANVLYYHDVINVASGAHSNNTDQFQMRYMHIFSKPEARWVRLHLADWNLGEHSYILLRSMDDGGQQRLDARSLPQWQNASAIFNGGRVMVELYVAPGEAEVSIDFDQLIYGPGQVWSDEIRSQCGPSDDRVPFTDNRVGRLYFGGCTAWRITTGAFLTAGHCVDTDPDQGGPGLPNGVLDLSGVVEFNVPLSNSSGSTNAANPNDQYPINTSGVLWDFDGSNASMNSIGEDWSVFGVFANSNTGLLPHEAYGFPFRLTRESPPINETIRITGFGADGGTANFTNQTHVGPYLGETFTNASDIFHEYQVDTEGGNSGSPVIWTDENLAIGIHTNAGCSATNGNSGTSFENDALENALRNFIHTNARFVDVGHPLRVSESGTAYRPYSTVALGVSNVPSGGVVSIVTGTYTVAAGNTFLAGADGKSMTLVAPVGSVVIGE